ncbi:MAG TPA: endonuclease Q family protein [Candidatus Bathyarchaeia archaeon]|nr:endonuclease Q family protein [Candidatus Bathyarchaeia archaeon]
MRIIADLHIHGRFSRATSERMNIEEIARYAKIKGLSLVGTGDFTHPKWLSEIKETLAQDADTGLYRVAKNPDSPMRFMLTTEVCTIFDFQGQSKKVHHVILAPSIDSVNQINVALEKHGDLASDGRPVLNMTAAQLVESVMEVSGENMVFPAHAWTPWFSIFGAFSGFDTVEECYQDMTRHIHALETGLSSDPPMNWRLSKLDEFTLVSNSDCHSFWPWRIGREANVFDLEQFTYQQVTDAIRTNDPARFKFTIETDPAYGKYHWTGHRNCNVSLSPKEAQKFNNICPVCRRKLTKGVEQRVEELADRPAGYAPIGKPGYKRLMPLSEIIAAVLDVGEPSTQAVWKIYNTLIGRFGDEYSVLLDASKDALNEVVDTQVADAILRVRAGSITVVPGFDGVYGRLVLGEAASSQKLREVSRRGSVQQMNLGDFW